MANKEKELLLEIAVGKGIMRKLPSYMNTNAINCKRTVAEETLFE